jgi:hypothetical protein
MRERRPRRLTDDDRGGTTVAQVLSPGVRFVVLVVTMLGLPPFAATVGGIKRRDRAFQFGLTAAGAIVAVFTLTATVRLADGWRVLAILAVVVAIANHLRHYRTDLGTLVVTLVIYLMPLALAVALVVDVFVPVLG